MTTTPNPIAALDAPLAVVEPAAILLEAAARTHSPSDAIADHLALYLITHPDAVTTPANPDWDHHIAQLVALNREWEIAAKFNAANPIGTPVYAYPGARPEFDKNCTRLDTRTRTKATVCPSGYAVIWVEGEGSWICLTHIDVRGEAS